jgi:hypothetical protein
MDGQHVAECALAGALNTEYFGDALPAACPNLGLSQARRSRPRSCTTIRPDHAREIRTPTAISAAGIPPEPISQRPIRTVADEYEQDCDCAQEIEIV